MSPVYYLALIDDLAPEFHESINATGLCGRNRPDDFTVFVTDLVNDLKRIPK